MRVDETRGADHRWGHHLHPELTRVPLLVRTPRSTPRVVDAPVSLVDVGPTLLEAAGLPPLDGVDGLPLGSVFGRPEPVRFVLSEATRYGDPARAARRGALRLVVDGEAERLYDLEADPLETHALGQEPSVEAERRALRGALPADGAAVAPPSTAEAIGQVLARFLR